jgi:Fe-S-cluster containining protein
MNSIDELCPQCGMCCDSTLFADVELRAGDDPRRLAALGLELQRKARTKLAAPQPCACFDGKLCKIYADRPRRCRLFECGLLKRVQEGEMPAAMALKRIARARKLAENVRNLLRASGQRDERLALTHRYTETMRAPVDLAVEGAADRRGELMLAVNDLMQMLEREFLK